MFIVTGEANLMLRVVTHNNKKHQDFLDTKIAPFTGVSRVSSQVITRTIKDEQGVTLFEEVAVNIISIVKVLLVVSPSPKCEDGKRYICCKICLHS